MHLAFVTDFPRNPEFPRGGVQSVSVNLLNGLRKLKGLTISVVTEDLEIQSIQQTLWNGLTVYRLPRKGRNMLTNAIGPGRKQMKTFLENLKPDIIHTHDIFGLMVKGISIPRVFTAHGQIFKDTKVSGGKFPRLRSMLWKHFEIPGWKDQPHIISISPYVREQMSGIISGIIHDIDNPIGSDCFTSIKNEKDSTIFSAAVINARKNTLSLLKAITLLIQRGFSVNLRLAGGHEKEYYQKVVEYVEQNNLSEHVVFTGQLSYSEIRREMSEASIFALVSLEENSPMVIEEAMAARIPVVTSNRCGMPYMVRDGETGFLINPENPKEIADRLQKLLENKNIRESMGNAGHSIALDRFHPDKVASRTYEVYLQALGD